MQFYYALDQFQTLNGPIQLPTVPGLGIQVPAGVIAIAQQLPLPDAGKTWIWNGSKAVQVEDNRGAVYHTETGALIDFQESLGPLPAGLTKLPRPSADHVWTGQEWQFDAALQAANRHALGLSLCNQVDRAADAARAKVAGDPLRAVEYQRAADEASDFKAGGYQGEVPPMVAAWAINGRTAQQAADNILSEAAQYTAALVLLRTVRLQAKERIRAAMSGGQVEQAESIAAETIASIHDAVAGVGNAGA